MEPTTDRSRERLIIGAGGLLLLVSLFLPWSSVGGTSQTGWEMFSSTDIYLLIVACVAMLAALTGGRIGLFRPDVSINGAADILSVVASILLVWLLAFDWDDGASRDVGVWLALVAAVAVMGAAGDYRPLRGGAPWFARLDR